MTRDDVIRMAREAGCPDPGIFAIGYQRFAALVAAAEREACAQACESTVWTASIPEWRDMTKHDIAVKSMLACASAIRARGAA